MTVYYALDEFLHLVHYVLQLPQNNWVNKRLVFQWLLLMLSFASNKANLAAQEQHFNKHLHKCGSWLSAHRPIVFTRIYAGIIPYSQIMPKIMPHIVDKPYLEPGNSEYEPKNPISPTHVITSCAMHFGGSTPTL